MEPTIRPAFPTIVAIALHFLAGPEQGMAVV